MTRLESFKLDSLKLLWEKIINNASLKFILSGLSFIGEFVFKAHKEALLTVFLLIVLDTVTGVIKAVKAGGISSREFFSVAAKLLIYSILMACASLVDRTLPVSIAMPVMYTFLAATEGLSILENISQAGFPVPTKLIDSLKVMKKKGED